MVTSTINTQRRSLEDTQLQALPREADILVSFLRAAFSSQRISFLNCSKVILSRMPGAVMAYHRAMSLEPRALWKSASRACSLASSGRVTALSPAPRDAMGAPQADRTNPARTTQIFADNLNRGRIMADTTPPPGMPGKLILFLPGRP